MRGYPGVLLLLVVLLPGCGGSQSDGPVRYPVSGRVTYAGAPVPQGEVLFEPDAAKGNVGPASTASIKDGYYELSASTGVVGKDYVIRISGNDGVATTLPDGMELPHGQPLFAEYQINRTLPEEPSTQDFEVPSNKP